MHTFSEDPTVTTCLELQREEIRVLESIYPYCVSTSEDSSKVMLKLEIPVELGDAKTVHIVDDGSTSVASGSDHDFSAVTLSLSSLPPVLLEVILPPTYPLSDGPLISSIHVVDSWMPRYILLHQQLQEQFQPGEGVLYTWIEWIRNAEFLRESGFLTSNKNAEIIRLPHPQPQLLFPRLSEHDKNQQLSQFSQNSYTCSVCFSSRKGAQCLLLSCGHIFCRDCLQGGWQLYIAEGDVEHVGCLDSSCVKEGREASEEEVRRVVTEEEVQRWKWLRQKRMFERDPTVVHCPVALCQAPVPQPSETVEEGSGWERLRTCPSCNYSFCSFCKRTWHGSLVDCPIPLSEKVILEYLEHPEGSAGRRVLETRFGSRNLTRMVLRYQENKANQQWLESHSMKCPQCSVQVEKSHGCNHMTCAKCKTHFCYRCGQRLSVNNPYQHFSTPGQKCYQKLFDASELGEDDWQPMEAYAIMEENNVG
ncbi:hypothetical protein K488DRAFT_76929 [Vararia minispora EC-137]|uniref:Uncharacterized protein n=1 Tax=Vararia minispora EC-137 TaxID=1314806 RepID=A0ACB8QTL0_9AGAM|nr:hypothetical protein K488DRAFT_76929 [Vararia minispora EC-137]